jgi:hypothetical protein
VLSRQAISARSAFTLRSRAYIISATVMYFGPFLPKKKESDKSGHVAVH